MFSTILHFHKFKDMDHSDDIIVIDSSLPAVLLNFRLASINAGNNTEDKQKVSSSILRGSSLILQCLLYISSILVYVFNSYFYFVILGKYMHMLTKIVFILLKLFLSKIVFILKIIRNTNIISLHRPPYLNIL